MKGIIYLNIAFFLLTISLYPQFQNDSDNTTEEERVIIPNENYKAGWFHKIFFGAHWRDLWSTPVKIKVLNLYKFAGGLKPSKKGGGLQTKSLRLIGNDGRQYKFRSLDKDPSKALPPELRESLAADVFKDQISSANPMAPLVVAPILNALGILQAVPELYIMPDDEKLGKFREEFGGIIGMIEIQPEAGDEDDGFAGAEKILSTYKLFKRLEKDNDEKVKALEFLKARLVDIYVGDWDRHVDQWKWAMFIENGEKFWYPIPRDRDQAFSRFDGLFPWITTQVITQMNSFSESYPKIESLTWSGRYIDRRFLSSIDKPQWDSVTNYVINHLTDSVITDAVYHMPPEMYQIAGENLIAVLKERRNNLFEASEIYYKNISKYVDIYGTGKDEFAEINRIDDHSVEVRISKRDKKTGGKKESVLYHRIFNDDYTKEIRIMLLDGDDYAIVRGEVNSSIPVIVAGDGDKDELVDSSEVKGYLLGFIPFIPQAEKKTYFYDGGNKTGFIKGAGTVISKKDNPKPVNDTMKYEPAVQDWGHDWRFMPWISFNPDEGLFIGGGPILYEFGFRTSPYGYRMELKAGYAAKPQKFKLNYLSEFYSLINGPKITIHGFASGIEVLNFYGFGNQTKRDKKLEKQNFYKVNQREFLIDPGIDFLFRKNISLSFGISMKYISTEKEGTSYLNQNPPYGSGDFLLAGINAGLKIDGRDNPVISTGGFYFAGGVVYYPSLRKDQNSFSKVTGNVCYYLPVPSLALSSLALRIYGEKNFGTYPFFESAFLGGNGSLRGFAKNRFAGEGSLSGSAELRLYLFKFFFQVPVYFGITAVDDIGRVFMPDAESKLWHNAYGGGIWLSIINPGFLFSFNYVRSVEDSGIYFTSGFSF
ncbi:MAG: BamA/TamA family outer membrane protein [Ignavibacteriaceae bacterium]